LNSLQNLHGVIGAAFSRTDDACDVRDDYKHFLAEAQSDAQATDAIAIQYGGSFDDLAATTAFWLALALTQWKMGRLDPRVKAAALRIIDEDLDSPSGPVAAPSRTSQSAGASFGKNRIAAAAHVGFAQPLSTQLPVGNSGSRRRAHHSGKLAFSI